MKEIASYPVPNTVAKTTAVAIADDIHIAVVDEGLSVQAYVYDKALYEQGQRSVIDQQQVTITGDAYAKFVEDNKEAYAAVEQLAWGMLLEAHPDRFGTATDYTPPPVPISTETINGSE